MTIEKEYTEISKVFENTKNIILTRRTRYLGTLLSVKPKYRTQVVLTGSDSSVIVKGLKDRNKYMQITKKLIGKDVYIKT